MPESNEAQHRLLVLEGADQGKVYIFQDDMSCIIGRASDSTIAVRNADISRYHVQINFSASEVIIEDLRSTNGTFVNQRRVYRERLLRSGDVIRLADAITLQYSRMPDISDADYTAVEVQKPEPAMEREPADEQAITSKLSPDSLDVPEHIEMPAPETSPSEARATSAPTWLITIVGILGILICACLATALFLWFSSAAFWERVFALLKIPVP